MAGLFRPSSRQPPSAYPSGLQPVASSDLNGGLSRRLSRTDLDFEAALHAEGTVRLREGVDVNSLGKSADTPQKPTANGGGSAANGNSPNNVVVVPPTPEHGEEDGRRKQGSMFRQQPGAAASTPDLRKKGKERETRPEMPLPSFLSPSGAAQGADGKRLRGTSSTSSFSMVSASSAALPRTPGGKDQNGRQPREEVVSPGTDWGLTSPRSRSGSKSGKSMRLRATTFLGKIMGQDKSQKSPSTYVAPPLFARWGKDAAPPVPQLPDSYLSNALPSPPPTLDVFTAPDVAKPLPTQPKTSIPAADEASESTILGISPSAADRTIKSHTRNQGSSSSTRRRSASVGELERQKKNSTNNSLPNDTASSPVIEKIKVSTEWDTNDILSSFRNDLSQLEAPISPSLDIKDPSTPGRRMSASRSRSSMEQSQAENMGTIRPRLAVRASTSAIDIHEKLKLDVDGLTNSTSSASSSPNRPSMQALDSPLRSTGRRTTPRSGPPLSASALYPRTLPSPILAGSSPSQPKARSATTPLSFSNPFLSQPSVIVSSSTPNNRRNSIQPRPLASFSEPVLMPGEEPNALRRSSQSQIPSTPDLRNSVRLVPSTGSFAYPASNSASQVDMGLDASPSKSWTSSSSLALPRGTSMEVDDIEGRGQELAKQFWEDEETFLVKEKFAEWLGGAGRLNAAALHYYINNYDFTNLRLDHAFRRFCAKLYLKGETQQVDRILSQFSRRYWECNSNTLYGNAGVVHAVVYSLLLLNTDLHVADLSTHMSRTQFVRNTLQAIQVQTRPSTTLTRSSTPELTNDDSSSAHARSEGDDNAGGTVKPRSKRSSSVHSWTSVSRETTSTVIAAAMSPGGSSSKNASTTSVETPTSGQAFAEFRIRQNSVTSTIYGRSWEIEMENMLREMYSAVKSNEIRQPAGFQIPATQLLAPNMPYNNTLYRHRSQRGQDRMAVLKRGSLRGLQTLLGQHTGASPYSSNSSIDGRDPRNGRISPSPSFATSETDFPTNPAFFTPALGFASNLSHTIIREAQEDDLRSLASIGSGDTDVSISDEELALLGAPWAKEGMLCRKQYWESTGKRAKSKAWQDVFVVIQKGELDMFIFGERGASDAIAVGGGNWTANARQVGSIVLPHSLAHILPPPGYNRQRPHCFALTLATGGVYFFQAGTEDLLNEWVSTCNYWAARLSKEPLSGGVSNMEYGWNRVLDPLSHIASIPHTDLDRTDTFSIRSGKGKVHDRIHINEWKPPMPSTVSSTHDEEAQLEALRKQIELLKKELETHNELRVPMLSLYSTRSSNLNKAQSNWEKKSQHLLTEIVKYETYVESLKSAMSLRLKKRGEKALERALVNATPVETDFTGPRNRKRQDSPGDDTLLGHETRPLRQQEGVVDDHEPC